LEDVKIAPVGHLYRIGEVTATPTASQTGSRLDVCERCGSTKETVLAKSAPVMVDAPKAAWKSGRRALPTFRSDAPLSEFLEVRVNGERISSDCYTLTEGSTVVELKRSYLKTLGAGDYTLEIVSVTGTASGAFSVSKSDGMLWVWLLVGAVAVLLIVGVVILLVLSRRSSGKTEKNKKAAPVKPSPSKGTQDVKKALKNEDKRKADNADAALDPPRKASAEAKSNEAVESDDELREGTK
jgi:hypothetical protein